MNESNLWKKKVYFGLWLWGWGRVHNGGGGITAGWEILISHSDRHSLCFRGQSQSHLYSPFSHPIIPNVSLQQSWDLILSLSEGVPDHSSELSSAMPMAQVTPSTFLTTKCACLLAGSQVTGTKAGMVCVSSLAPRQHAQDRQLKREMGSFCSIG